MSHHRTITDILIDKYTDICTTERELELKLEEVQYQADDLYHRICETEGRHQAFNEFTSRARKILAEIDKLP